MSGPFVYRPSAAPVAYDMPRFQTPYIHSPRSRTPFIPDSPMASPYSRPPSLNPSPNLAVAPLPQFQIAERCAIAPPRTAYDAGFNNVWEPRRERLPLWQEGNQNPWPGTSPLILAPMDNVGNIPGVSPYAQRRRHSFSSAYSPSVHIHPLLNGENPVQHFVFDLSSPTSNPLVYFGDVERPVSPEILAQPATYPLITRMRIISDSDILPKEWDTGLDLSAEWYEFNVRAGYDLPPITVHDVLQELHRNMQTQISHNDWARLSREGTEKVRLAFSRRCQAAGGPDAYEVERAKGVRRVDYLSGKTRFIGLVKTGIEDTFRFVTTDP